MSAFRENTVRFVPRTVSDTVDGDNSPEGACTALQNLIWSPDTPNVLECRPANIKISTFSGFTSPGVVSLAYQVGGIIYGLVASGLYTGKDQPFAYNVATNTFLTLQGVTSANCPTSQSTTGAWTPPQADMAGSKIAVSHVGFNFAGGYAFGYFDISGFSQATTGNITSGSNTVTGAPLIAGVGPGYLISGTGIPANTTVTNTASFSLTTTGNTNSNTSLTSVANTTGLAKGQSVTGVGIPTGTTISSISGSTITLSQAATATATGISVYFAGATITMSANASSSTSGLSITIAGGTATSPLWAAGNTTGVQQLPAVAQAVHQFNNRFYFGVANAVVATDPLSLNIGNTNGVQVLTIDDNAYVTAFAVLPFYSTTGGIVQALIIFKQYSIWQVTGDFTSNNILLNQLSGAVGTSAPRSVVQVPQGIYFMASDGIRNISLTGEVSEPDTDLALPFIYAVNPSRANASFNADIYRICVQNGNHLNSPYEEYWYFIKYGSWTGPHTFRVDCSVAYNNTWILFNNAISGTMWQGYAVQNQNATGNTFVENGTQLTWSYQTCPMTSNNNMYTNCTIRTTLDLAEPATGDVYTFEALDVNNGSLASATLAMPSSVAVWYSFLWGASLWGAQQFGLEPVTVPWTTPLTFNKLVLQASGNSSLGLKLGSWYIGYEKLGYLKQ